MVPVPGEIFYTKYAWMKKDGSNGGSIVEMKATEKKYFLGIGFFFF